MTLTHYIYNISFVETPKFNYAAALSVFILVGRGCPVRYPDESR